MDCLVRSWMKLLEHITYFTGRVFRSNIGDLQLRGRRVLVSGLLGFLDRPYGVFCDALMSVEVGLPRGLQGTGPKEPFSGVDG